MQIFIDAIQVFLIPQVVAGLLGGLIGVRLLFKAYVELYKFELTLLFSVLGVISSGAVSEYFFTVYQTTSIFLHVLLGAGSAVVGLSGSDILRVAAPKLVKDVIDGAGETLVQRVINLFKPRG